MTSVRQALSQLDGHLAESSGLRRTEHPPQLVSSVSPKDIGRRALKSVGRIDITQVIPDPQQPRTQFSDESLSLLADSIRTKGQLSPIRVRWSDMLSKYCIISGERRWRACQLAGLTTIDCCIQEAELSQSHILEEQLVENLLRDELNPIEEARAFRTLIDLNGWTGKQLAAALSIPASKVTRTLALFKLPADVQAKVAEGMLPARTAYELSRVKSPTTHARLTQGIVAGDIPVGNAVRVASQREQRHQSRDATLTFLPEGGWRITVANKSRRHYEEVEAALVCVLEEVRHRIRNRVRWR